jgi:hypothetical protein
LKDEPESQRAGSPDNAVPVSACPWEEILGFYDPGEYDRLLDRLNKAVQDGTVREVPVDRTVMEGRYREQMWFQDIPSGEVWQLYGPPWEGKGNEGAFLRVHFTPYPIWERRQRGEPGSEPFWRRGSSLEHEQFNDEAERAEFFAWLDAQLARGRLRRVLVPDAVTERSLGTYPWDWLVDVETGAAWQFNKREVMPLELPPSLEAYRPKKDA